MIARALVAVVLTASVLGQAHAERHRVVAVLEYRSGTRGAAGVTERLARLLKNNAAFEVLDVLDARRRAGPRIDAEVAHCSGEPSCIAEVGEKLGADEVLLVGVSQLGDIVLALSRIDVGKGEAGARLAESIAADSEASDDVLLGWLRQLYPPDAFRRYGAIRVVTDVAGARIELNGQPSGVTPLDGPLRVRAPATYRLKLAKPQYVAFQARIDVLPDATVEVRAALVRETLPLPWFKRWYVWAAIGGGLAVTTIVLATYYATRVDETPQGFIQLPPKTPTPALLLRF